MESSFFPQGTGEGGLLTDLRRVCVAIGAGVVKVSGLRMEVVECWRAVLALSPDRKRISGL